MRRAGAALLAGLIGVSLSVPAARAADVTLAAAGDIACGAGQAPADASCQQDATASLLGRLAPDAVAALGDEQYESGSPYPTYDWDPFDQSWGAADLRPLLRPAPGNHEYHQTSPGPAAGYFGDLADELAPFGPAASDPSKGWYSYELGGWHVIALNSAGCVNGYCDAVNVPQEEVDWLNADMAAHPGVCTLAYWHHPLFASPNSVFGDPHALDAGVEPLWAALYAHHADVVLNGHEHNYERFAPQDPQGAPDPAGLREFVVGTGGENHHAFAGPDAAANSQARDDQDFGVLLLTLQPGSYSWRFVRTDGTDVDSGWATCHSNRPAPAGDVTAAPSPTPAASPAAAAPAAALPDAAGSIQKVRPRGPSLHTRLRSLLRAIAAAPRARLERRTWRVVLPSGRRLTVEVAAAHPARHRPLLEGRAVARRAGPIRLRLRRTGPGALRHGPLLLTAVVRRERRTVAVIRVRT